MFASLFNSLFNISMELAKAVDNIINWLDSPLVIGFNVPVFGFLGLTLVSPFALISGGVLILIGFWAIKSLVPML